MDIAALSEYDLLERINEHGPFSAYRARNTGNGRLCFLKLIRFDQPDAVGGFRQHVIEALRLQETLLKTQVVRAVRFAVASDQVLVEYPWLELGDWVPASEVTTTSELADLLIGVCFALDYLHQFDLVHGDAKLHNFMVHRRGDRTRVLAADLELLCASGSNRRPMVFGSPDHIPPEILTSDRITSSADQYSLGISIRAKLQELDRSDSQLSERLTALADQFCHSDYHQRPRFLLDACHRLNLISDPQFAGLSHALLRATLVTRIRQQGNRLPRTAESLSRFIVERLRLHGVSQETVQALFGYATTHGSRLWLTCARMIARAQIQHVDNFWFLAVDDNVLLDRYQKLEPAFGAELARSDQSPDDAAAVIEFYRGERAFEKAYLVARRQIARCADQPETPAIRTEKVRWYVSAGQSLACLGRQSDAYDQYRAAFLLRSEADPDYGELLHEATVSGIRGGRSAETNWVWPLIDRELATCKDVELGLKFERLAIYRLIAELKWSEAAPRIASMIESSRAHGLKHMIVAGKYLQAINVWRAGDLPAALEILTQVIEGCDSTDVSEGLASVLTLAASLCADRCQYDSLISYSKRAIAMSQLSPSSYVLPSAYASLVIAYSRMANGRKAEYWLLRMLQDQEVRSPVEKVLRHYLLLSTVEQEQGRLDEARALLDRGVHVHSSERRVELISKMYQSQAKLAWWAGDTEACLKSVAQARETLATGPGSVTAFELDLIEFMGQVPAGGKVDVEKLKLIGDRLSAVYSDYFAAMAAFHLYEQGPEAIGELTRQRLQELVEARGTDSIPLVQATARLMACYRPSGETTMVERLAAWKFAFNVLYRGHQQYFAYRAAVVLSQLYISTNKFSHARKFLLLARSLSQGLRNSAEEAWINHLLSTVTSESATTGPLVESFHVMSELVKEVTNYRETLQKMVHYAAELTGAERAVLFLSRGPEMALEVAASVNCDDRSLTELTEFSTTLPTIAAKEKGALIIDDALQSPATRDLASVVRHNILSVACIPLFSDGVLQAVLYLDHHTIPALFDPADLRYLTTVGNFMSVVLGTAREVRGLTLLNRRMRDQIETLGGEHTFITADRHMRGLIDTLPMLARSTASVLIQGESGTGKEIICEFLHSHSPRSKENLVKVNCAAISPTLIESELFGIAKGVATGVAEREGKFVAADRGTLYLDEIGDMPLEMQGKILRAVEYQQFERVGSNRPIKTDIRFICGTNADLRKLVEEGKFRKDLFYRINTVVVEIPPLRKRPADIPLLIEHFVQRFSPAGRPPRLSESALEALIEYAWPGNVRELRNFVERTCIFFSGRVVDFDDLPPEVVASCASAEPEAKDALLRSRIVRALTKSKGNQTEAARSLRMAVTTLRRHMARFGISSSDFQ